MNKNILILTPFYPPNIGGAETFVEGLVEEAKRRFNVTVLTFQPFKHRVKKYEYHSYDEGDLEIIRMNWSIKHGDAWQGVSLKNFLSVFPKMLFGAFKLCRKEKFKIIHAQGLIAGLAAVLLKKVFKCKVYITLLALYGFDKQKSHFKLLTRFIFKNTDLIFVEGENGKRDVKGIMEGMELRVFSHWCDQTIFRPPQNRDSSRIRVLFIGRPIPEKGRHIIEQAERILNNSKYEFTYVENASHKDLPKYYQMAHIVVVPSLYPEGYSRVVIESASCACAVITSNKGSLPEMVKDFGHAINPTANNFAEKIQELSDPERIKGLVAYSHALWNFSPRNAEVFINEYEND